MSVSGCLYLHTSQSSGSDRAWSRNGLVAEEGLALRWLCLFYQEGRLTIDLVIRMKEITIVSI